MLSNKPRRPSLQTRSAPCSLTNKGTAEKGSGLWNHIKHTHVPPSLTSRTWVPSEPCLNVRELAAHLADILPHRQPVRQITAGAATHSQTHTHTHTHTQLTIGIHLQLEGRCNCNTHWCREKQHVFDCLIVFTQTDYMHSSHTDIHTHTQNCVCEKTDQSWAVGTGGGADGEGGQPGAQHHRERVFVWVRVRRRMRLLKWDVMLSSVSSRYSMCTWDRVNLLRIHGSGFGVFAV